MDDSEAENFKFPVLSCFIYPIAKNNKSNGEKTESDSPKGRRWKEGFWSIFAGGERVFTFEGVRLAIVRKFSLVPFIGNVMQKRIMSSRVKDVDPKRSRPSWDSEGKQVGEPTSVSTSFPFRLPTNSFLFPFFPIDFFTDCVLFCNFEIFKTTVVDCLRKTEINRIVRINFFFFWIS